MNEKVLICFRIFPCLEEFNRVPVIIISMIYVQYFWMAYVWTVIKGKLFILMQIKYKYLALFTCYMQPLPWKTEPAPILCVENSVVFANLSQSV